MVLPEYPDILKRACCVQERLGGAGVYSADLRKRWQLANSGWKYDIAPEIIEGHNIADFIDPDIEAKLAALEAEEDAFAAAAASEVSHSLAAS